MVSSEKKCLNVKFLNMKDTYLIPDFTVEETEAKICLRLYKIIAYI